MSPTVSLILDLLMVGLLVATIAYAIILNRQIIRLRENRGELAELIKGLNEAMNTAESGVRSMKQTAHRTGDDLHRAMEKATALRDELQFMLEAGNTLADRLSGSDSNASKLASQSFTKVSALRLMSDEAEKDRVTPLPSRPAAAASPSAPVLEREKGLSRSERELLRAIENR